MLALAIVAKEVNFVCRHVLCCITATLNCNDTNIKFVPNHIAEVRDMIFLRVFVTVLIRSTIYNPVGPNLAVKRK